MRWSLHYQILLPMMAVMLITLLGVSLLNASKQGPREVRLSAITAPGRVGNASCLLPLLELAKEDDDELSQAAMPALSDISDEAIDSEIVSLLSKDNLKSYPLLRVPLFITLISQNQGCAFWPCV
ncbi:MAG: HEAT repeat domain-containing protein, partial [Planctomycetaceae bacterium]|nr:HEAT repeat domain-containing protein [Planctomycetaceae bacterium]